MRYQTLHTKDRHKYEYIYLGPYKYRWITVFIGTGGLAEINPRFCIAVPHVCRAPEEMNSRYPVPV